MEESNISSGGLAKATLHSEGELGSERHDTSRPCLGCIEFIARADGWAVRGEWGLASAWYALAASSEDPRNSREAWLAGFYSAMSLLLDRSLPVDSPEGIETIRAACNIATEGAMTQEYIAEDHAALQKRIDSTSTGDVLWGLQLEHARALLHTKLWRRYRGEVDTVLGKTRSIQEKIEAHLIQACYASFRKRAKMSLLKSFGNALQLKFGKAAASRPPQGEKIVASQPRPAVTFDKLIKSLASLFFKEGAGPDVSRKINNLDTGEADSTTIVQSGRLNLLKQLWRESNPAERVEAKKDFKIAEIEDYHRLIFNDLETPATVDGLQEWLDDNVDSRCALNGIPFTAKALQHFRSKLKIDYELIDPNTGKPVLCRVEGHNRSESEGGDYFEFFAPGRNQPSVVQRNHLPPAKALKR